MPSFSQTVLLKNLYHNPMIDTRQADAFAKVASFTVVFKLSSFLTESLSASILPYSRSCIFIMVAVVYWKQFNIRNLTLVFWTGRSSHFGLIFRAKNLIERVVIQISPFVSWHISYIGKTPYLNSHFSLEDWQRKPLGFWKVRNHEVAKFSGSTLFRDQILKNSRNWKKPSQTDK